MAKLKAGAALSYCQLAVSNALGLLITPLLLRHLGQSGFGVYALMGVVAGYLAILDFGLTPTVVRYVALYRTTNDKHKESVLVSVSLLIAGGAAILSGVAACAGYPLLRHAFSRTLDPEQLASARTMFLLLSANVALSFPFAIYSAVLAGHERFVLLRTLALIRAVVRATAIAALLLLGYKGVAIVALDLVATIVFGIAGVAIVHASLRVHLGSVAGALSLAKELAGHSGFIFLSLVVDLAYWRIGPFLLGLTRPPGDVAVVALAMMVVSYFVQLSAAMSGVFLPRVTQLAAAKGGDEALQRLFVRVGRAQFLVLSCVLGGFVLFGRAFIRLWAGEQYSDAWLFALLLLVPLMVPLTQNIGIAVLQARNQHRFRALSYLLIAALNVVATHWAIARMGAIGAVLGTAISLVLGNIVLMNWYYQFKAGLRIAPFFWHTVVRLTPASACAMLVCLPLVHLDVWTWGDLALRLGGYLLAFGIAAWFFGLNDSERSEVLVAMRRTRASIA